MAARDRGARARPEEPRRERPPRCASCGEPVGPEGTVAVPDVAFCGECVRRSHPGPEVELGVVDLGVVD